ncbi:hypothetical protein EMCRGX_G019744 [Ephydatia muelleri]
MALSQYEKLLFPGFLLAFQVAFLILFGLLVRYDETGAGAEGDSELASVGLANNLSGGSPSDVVLKLASTKRITKSYPMFQDVHVMIFIGFGFLMTFLKRYGFGSIGFNFLIAAFVLQWYTITGGLFTFIEQAHHLKSSFVININVDKLILADFGAASVLITFGAILGKASPFQVIIIAFFEVMFYSANEALNTFVFKAADVGGSMTIHAFGAYFGLAVSTMMYKKKATDHPRNKSVYYSDLFSMIGTVFLWLYWPSFNAALQSGNAQSRAILNTYYSLTGSVMATFIWSMVVNKDHKLAMTHIQNATLAGGVAVGSIADMMIQPWGAILVGFTAGSISVFGYKYLSPIMAKWFYIQDTCGVNNLHGMPAILSAIASAIAAGVASVETHGSKIGYGNGLYFVFPGRAPANVSGALEILNVQPGTGRTAGTQAGYQLAFMCSSVGISIFGGILTGVIVTYLRAFQPTEVKDYFDDENYWETPQLMPESKGVESTDNDNDCSCCKPRQRRSYGVQGVNAGVEMSDIDNKDEPRRRRSPLAIEVDSSTV